MNLYPIKYKLIHCYNSASSSNLTQQFLLIIIRLKSTLVESKGHFVGCFMVERQKSSIKGKKIKCVERKQSRVEIFVPGQIINLGQKT